MPDLQKLEQVLVHFVQQPQWAPLSSSAPPEDNPEWRAGYEAALGNLREELKPWWPFGGPLNLVSKAPAAAELPTDISQDNPSK